MLEALQPGEALVIRGNGLRQSVQYSVTLLDGKNEISTQSLMSDRHGMIRDTVVWAHVGIDDPREKASMPLERSIKQWAGKEIAITLSDLRKATIAEAKITVTGNNHPLVLPTDAEGLLKSGFEAGEMDAHLSLLGLKKGTNLRVWMVPRQHEWNAGDLIRPVTLAGGRLAQTDIEIKSETHHALVFKSKELYPGAYDFIIRPIRYGFEDDDDLMVRDTDILSGWYSTGLVIREKFMPSKVIRGGCTNLQQIACRRTLGGMWPYVQYSDVFQVGEDVWGALDPNAFDPSHVGKGVAIYIVPHKTAVQWTADNSLNHLAVLGGNAAVQKWVTQSWCVNANLRLLWPNATQIGEYDVIADFGNNSPTLAGFVPDDHFDMPLDMIDGYILPGFRIVADPTVDTSFPHAGAFSYDSTTQGSVTVADDSGPVTVPLNANVRFPADIAGATSAAQISATNPNYPVVVLIHGNSGHTNSYQGYDYLLDHLALNGFIAVSFHMQPGQEGTGRARLLRNHLQIIFSMFGSHAANNIGIMGHSRGGEAVVIAARLNQQEAWGYNINAVISLAPTNQYTNEHFGGAWAAPYLVVYGSLDGDLAGIGDTGFELYDHASGMNKSMAFVYRSCHDRFNTVWGSDEFAFMQLTLADQAAVLSINSHQLIAKGYMGAFFRQHLKAETQWEGIFKGEWVPAAVIASDPNMKIYTQYEDTVVRTMDDFEGAHTATSWQTSTIGGAVSQSGLPATPQENDLRTMDAQSPHATAGLVLQWDNITDALNYVVPVGQRDVSGFKAVSFRISQRVGSASNPAGQVQDLRLTLTDGAGFSRAIRISKLAEIPYPYERGFSAFTKSAMCTIRIPLSVYHIHCLNVDQVDLTNITALSFQFAEKMTGEIEIDSIQFTN